MYSIYAIPRVVLRHQMQVSDGTNSVHLFFNTARLEWMTLCPISFCDMSRFSPKSHREEYMEILANFADVSRKNFFYVVNSCLNGAAVDYRE